MTFNFCVFRFRPERGRPKYRIKFGNCTIFESSEKGKAYIINSFLNEIGPDHRKNLIASLECKEKYIVNGK